MNLVLDLVLLTLVLLGRRVLSAVLVTADSVLSGCVRFVLFVGVDRNPDSLVRGVKGVGTFSKQEKKMLHRQKQGLYVLFSFKNII